MRSSLPADRRLAIGLVLAALVLLVLPLVVLAQDDGASADRRPAEERLVWRG